MLIFFKMITELFVSKIFKTCKSNLFVSYFNCFFSYGKCKYVSPTKIKYHLCLYINYMCVHRTQRVKFLPPYLHKKTSNKNIEIVY